MSTYTHVTVGTNDMKKAQEFYDKVLAPLGFARLFETETMTGWGASGGPIPDFIVCLPRDGNTATNGNGVTIGLLAKDAAAVDGFHAAAMELGGTDEGAPGPREAVPNSYGAYIRDHVGNKLCAFAILPG